MVYTKIFQRLKGKGKFIYRDTNDTNNNHNTKYADLTLGLPYAHREK